MSQRCQSKRPHRHTTDPEILARRADTRAAQCEERTLLYSKNTYWEDRAIHRQSPKAEPRAIEPAERFSRMWSEYEMHARDYRFKKEKKS